MALLLLVLLATPALACAGDQLARSADELGIQVTEVLPQAATDAVRDQAALLHFCFEKLEVEHAELDVVRSDGGVTVTGAGFELQECVRKKVGRWELTESVSFPLSFDESR